MNDKKLKEFEDLKTIENLSPNVLNLWEYYHYIVDYENGEGTVLVFSSEQKRLQTAQELNRSLSLVNAEFKYSNFPVTIKYNGQVFYLKTLDELNDKIASGIYYSKYKDMHFVE